MKHTKNIILISLVIFGIITLSYLLTINSNSNLKDNFLNKIFNKNTNDNQDNNNYVPSDKEEETKKYEDDFDEDGHQGDSIIINNLDILYEKIETYIIYKLEIKIDEFFLRTKNPIKECTIIENSFEKKSKILKFILEDENKIKYEINIFYYSNNKLNYISIKKK